MNETTKAWLSRARAEVEAALRAFLEAKLAAAAAVDPEAHALAQAVSELSLRGGKRLRGALVILGHELAGGTSSRAVWPAAVAFELLQSHLLIQDDWMDRDELRRGGPSVHHALAQRLGDDHKGASLAILASDLAWAWAVESLLASEVSEAARLAATLAFSEVETEVVYGQLLDVLGAADIEKTHRLKTAGYTVAGPLRLGALLGGAAPPLLGAIDAFALPLGVAFQLRDDLLGAFGEPGLTGKPVGADLRAGKRTLIVSLAERQLEGQERELLELVLGNPSVEDEALERLTAALEARGLKARVQAKAEALEAEARAALDRLPSPQVAAIERLREVVELLAARRG